MLKCLIPAKRCQLATTKEKSWYMLGYMLGCGHWFGSLRSRFGRTPNGPRISVATAVISRAIQPPVGSNECVTTSVITSSDDTPMSRIFHPLLALIASATDKELAKYLRQTFQEFADHARK